MKSLKIWLPIFSINKKQKTEKEIKNGQSRDGGNIGHTRHRTKINKNSKTQHRKRKRWLTWTKKGVELRCSRNEGKGRQFLFLKKHRPSWIKFGKFLSVNKKAFCCKWTWHTVNGHKYSSPSILRYIFHIKPHFSIFLLLLPFLNGFWSFLHQKKQKYLKII